MERKNKEKIATVFYHDDLDGQLSGYWIYTELSKRYPVSNIRLVPIDYHMTFPIDSIQDRQEVWIVDFSISPSDMKRLLKKTLNVVWIDHHKTAIEKYTEDIGIDIRSIDGVRKVGDAACLLTYQYVTKNYTGAPLFVQHVDDYDTWKWKIPQTNEFILGMTVEDTDPKSTLWSKLLNGERYANYGLYNKICDQGLLIDKFIKKSSQNALLEYAFPVTWENYRCLVINNVKITNLWKVLQTMELWQEGKFDILMGFIYLNGKWRVELRSPEKGVDVGTIAKSKGGGGHTHASGFMTEVFPI